MTTLTFQVTTDDTAIALGSGDVPVLATPRLLAWLEAATVAAAVDLLDDAQTSVGTEVTMVHLRATPVGRSVLVTVDEVARTGNRLEFRVAASEYDEGRGGAVDAPFATARITRAVVDRARFLDHLR